MSRPELNFVPSLPASAPFTPEQRAWLNGFLAGVFQEQFAVDEEGRRSDGPQTKSPLLVMFGSQTGTAENLAKKFAKEAAKKNFEPRVLPLNDFAQADLTKAARLVVITSTWGDGDPPDNAVGFWSWLNSESAPRLENLSFAVLGLGDKSYGDFCGAGKKFDQRLAVLGAQRLIALGECDVDYETTAQAWRDALWPVLESKPASSESGISPASPSSTATGLLITESPLASSLSWSRTHPFAARLKTNRRLNGTGSAKDTRHFEIVLDGSGLNYEVGDALGVLPTNCPVLVEELLAALGCKGEEPVRDARGNESTLHEALLKTFVITQASPPLIHAAAERANHSELLALLVPEQKANLDKWLLGRDLVDVLRACPGVRFTPTEFTGLLRPLQLRLYSISSSLKMHPGEVHLTVAAVRYEAHGRAKKGVASCWLADRVTLNETPVPVFVQTSHGFRPPTDGATPMIMVGPGTGIAPFRAFLEERRANGAKGRNWLFFGDQQRACDFLYEEELTAMASDGLLTRLDLAFSRDQAEKIYVQNRMLEHATELWRWLDKGAHFYVCGDAKRMAKDVDAALHRVIEQAGGKTPEQSAEYIAKLKSEKRYQRDVY
ncbi:MAG: sulfite reductase subunit alpha [Verrucomicrobia bacterium]|nr:sulfite reductase subunit alpha [Verrucomicrobiota bacterium]